LEVSRHSLAGFLRRHKRIGLDTSVFIYQLEDNPKYIELVHPVFRWLEEPASFAATSTVTMLELLVHPYRRSDEDIVNRFYALMSTYPNLHWVDLTLPVADAAARLRAKFNLKTPDAVQAASALASQATGFISNDPAFRRIQSLDVLILDDLLLI
jgi:predicted nucleic acid-binding protein